MTEPKKPTPEKENSPAAPNFEETRPTADKNPSRATGFFNRVQPELNPEPIHPSEAAEIVVDPETLE